MLTITDLTFRIAGRTLLEDASLTLPSGHRAGLIGRNGTGKSTLLKLITGELQPDAGSIQLPNGMRIGRIAQEAPEGPQSLLATVLAADHEREELLSEVETVTDPHRIAEIHQRLHEISAHSAPSRAAEILYGLGFDAEQQQRPCQEFSGGWRMRVALAALLFQQPDLLLLDEPTNHLDLEATLWLEDYLRRYPHTVLIVSHDRDLLNRAVDKIIHLHERKLTLYTGGYDTFERTRAERLALQSALAAKQEAQRKHIMSYVDRFRYKASKARQAQSRLKALARMQPIAAAVEERGIEFSFPEPEKLAPPLLTLDQVSVGYEEGKPILRRLDIRLDPDDRIALLGANGNGKSTLVKLLAGKLQPMSGEMRRSPKIKVGYFAQHQADELDLEATPLQVMGRAASQLTPEKCRAHLATFGIDEDKVGTKVRDLSGGEKARLLLALMCNQSPNLLLLDEPSNHLDIDSRQALVQAVNDFPGAVLIISHDPHLIELTADRLWLVKDGTCQPFDEDLDAYRALLLQQSRADKDRGNDGLGGQRKEARRQAAGLRAETAHLKRQVDQSSLAVEKFAEALKLIEKKLAEPDFYAASAPIIAEWQMKHAEVARKLAEAEDAWLHAQDALERALSEG